MRSSIIAATLVLLSAVHTPDLFAGDPPGAAAGTAAAVAAQSAAGTITNIDVNNGKVSIRTKGAGKASDLVILTVAASTKITRNGKDAMLGDLKTGDTVHVSYQGSSTADQTVVTFDATAAKSSEKKGKYKR